MHTRLVHLREKARVRQFNLCFYCGVQLAPTNSAEFEKQFRLSPTQVRPLRCTAEHLQPRKDGGKDQAGNIVASCQKCNFSRHAHGKDLEPEQHKIQIQKQVAKGKWHKAYVFHRKLIGQRVSSVKLH